MRSRIACGLICVFLYLGVSPMAFAITPVRPSRRVQRIRSAIVRLGTGEQTRVAVRLTSGARLKGYISSADDETLTITDLSTGVQEQVKYSDIAQARGQNLTSGQKLAIGTVFIVGLLVALLLMAHSAR